MTYNTTTATTLFKNSHNVTEEGYDDYVPLSTSEYLLCTAFIIIMLTGIIGNSLVCYIFGYKRKQRSRSTTEWLILYLGIIDLFASICNPPLFIFWTITRYSKWPFGALGCKILPALGPITTSASAGILLIFAIDRYMAIVTPFMGQFSWKAVTAACIVNVVLSVLSNVHYIYSLDLFYDDYCYVPNVQSLEYGVPNCLFIILRLSVFLLIFCYTNIRIFMVLSKRDAGNGLANQQFLSKRNKQSKRIMIVLLTMGIVFILLVFPREMFYLVYNLSWINSDNGISYNTKILEINSWLKVFHTANSCANVFIYSQMQSYYRKHVLRLLFYLGCCKTKIGEVLDQIVYDTRYSTTRRPSGYAKTKCYYTQDIDNGVNDVQSTFFKRALAWRTKRDDEIPVFM